MSWNFTAVLFRLGMCGLISLTPAPTSAGTKPTLTLGRQLKGGQARIVLQAERLQYRPGLGRILLSGKVDLRMGPLKLRAGKVTVVLDPRGRPTRVEARGQVRFDRGKSSGSARGATLILAHGKRRIILQGKPRLRWTPLGLTLEGHRIEVDLETGRLNVQQARACLHKDARESEPNNKKPAPPVARKP